jgi:PhzF family phenazine biosynthesis protein
MNMIPYFEVHSFTDSIFHGNPAGVCLLEAPIHDDLMLKIAAENNLSETAFVTANDDGYELRWFTPTVEVDLCGHATLAASYVFFDHLEYEGDAISFETKSGELTVWKDDGFIVMDFPSRPPEPTEIPSTLAESLGKDVEIVLKARDYVVVFDKEKDVQDIRPDFGMIAELDSEGVIVTAPGDDVDFVSRYFAPQEGIPEDSVTGAAHCTLAPYWSQRLGEERLRARQISQRGGELWLRAADDRVMIAGRAVLYAKGFLNVD